MCWTNSVQKTRRDQEWQKNLTFQTFCGPYLTKHEKSSFQKPHRVIKLFFSALFLYLSLSGGKILPKESRKKHQYISFFYIFAWHLITQHNKLNKGLGSPKSVTFGEKLELSEVFRNLLHQNPPMKVKKSNKNKKTVFCCLFVSAASVHHRRQKSVGDVDKVRFAFWKHSLAQLLFFGTKQF